MTRHLAIVCCALAMGPIAAVAQDTDDACGAAGLQGLVGQSGEIARLLDFGERRLRVLPPNSVVTQDFRIDRLNIHLDEDDRIVRIDCG